MSDTFLADQTGILRMYIRCEGEIRVSRET